MNELLALGISLLLAKLAEEAFDRAKLVRFLGPVTVGVLLGPGVLNVITVDPVISFASGLGIVFLLFLAGAEELESGVSVNLRSFAAAVVELLLPLVSVSAFLYFTGSFSPLVAVPLAMTSVGPMTRLLSDLGIMRTKEGTAVFTQGLVNEVTAIVAFSALMDLNPAFVALNALFLVAVIFGGRAFASLLKRGEVIIRAREAETAFIISLILILGYFTSLLNFNLAITAFFLGAILREYLSERPQILSRLRAITYGFFEPLFFVSIGLYFVKVSEGILAFSLGLAAVVIASKVASGYLGGLISRLSTKVSSLGTSTKGGVDVSLLITALSTSLIGEAQYTASALAITFSALVVPLAFRALNKGEVRPTARARSVKDVAVDLKVSAGQTLREAVDLVEKHGVRALIVVDEEMKPVGTITVTTLIETPVELYSVLRVNEVQLDDAVTINDRASLSEALNLFAATGTAVIAVVDREGKFVGALYERKVLEAMLKS